MTTTVLPTTATTLEESATVTVPLRADCIADSAGGLTFEMAGAERAGRGAAAGGDGAEGAALVLRLRGADAAADEVRLPLSPAADGRLRAHLPASRTLPEGRWDVHLAPSGSTDIHTDADSHAGLQRLMPGLNDLRALVDREPEPGTGPLTVRIPYATKHGNLSLRSWLRAVHAEAGEIRVDDGVLSVRGRVHRVERPADWLSGAVAEARPRGGGEPVSAPVTAVEGDAFAFTLPYAELTAGGSGGAEVWDLWLRPTSGARVRIARLLDDVADKKEIFSYPARRVAVGESTVQAGPYYTVDNDLSVRVGRTG